MIFSFIFRKHVKEKNTKTTYSIQVSLLALKMLVNTNLFSGDIDIWSLKFINISL